MQTRPDSPTVALATCAALPRLSPDDALLREALESRGIRALPLVWDDGAAGWDSCDACLVRSTWDYHEKREEFLAWARRVGAAAPLWNPPPMLAWNSDKAYLRQLATSGVPTVPTRWLERGRPLELAALLAELGWTEAVLKPTVDLGARNLHRVTGSAADQEVLEALLAEHEVMLQPFLRSVPERGETSLVWVGGELAHTVRKRPRAGDFRVQPSWGGSAAAVRPSAAELAVAERALAALETAPLYARVDLVESSEGETCLIELELIEPLLFLAEHPPSAELLADRIAALL